MKSRWIGRFALVGVGIFLGTLILLLGIPASASMDEARISRLESNLSQLETQVNQLSSQIRSLESGIDRPRPNPVEVPPVAQPERSSLADDPMFDRLATLVIELKRRMDGLEERLVQLER